MKIAKLYGLFAGLCLLYSQGIAAVEAIPVPPPVALFAAHAQIQDVKISPDGKLIAFTYEEAKNEVKLAIATSDLKAVKFVLGYGEDHHMGRHFWANNNRVVAWDWKNSGYLDGRRQWAQLVAFDIDGKNRETIFVPERSNIRIYSRLRNDPDNILVGTYHWADEGQISLQKLNVQDGRLDYIGGLPAIGMESQIVDVGVDTDDVVRIAIEVDRGKDEYDDDDNVTLLHYKTEAGEWRKKNIETRRPAAKWSRLGFSRDNRLYYFLSNYDMEKSQGLKHDTLGVFAFDFETTKITPVFRHPDVDIQDGIYGPDGEVLGVNYQSGYPTQYYFDDNNQYVRNLKALAATFPGQRAVVNNYTDDGKTAIVRVYSDRNPGMYYLYRDGTLKLVASTLPDIDAAKMGTTEAFVLNARDGVKLYGFITLPPGPEQSNLPMVVYPHGGPYGPYDRWGYDPQVQVLATRGYAVLQVNFRGSGGFGTDFEESGYRQWGRKMQDDVTDATLWAVQQGIADKDRICISGGSYGGYATLQGVVREPDLYKCAIGIAGVYSLPMMWKKGDMRRLGAKQFSDVFLKKFIGDDEEELKKYSPAYNVDKIKAALFIIHGSKDVRVPLAQAEFLRDQLDSIGKPYQWLIRKEGHGFTQVANRIEQYEQMLSFLDLHIGSAAKESH